MPVIGLTTDIVPRFPRLGKLKKGGEKNGKGEMGPDLDHFRFATKDPEIEKAFSDTFGPKPRAITVYIAYPTPEEAFTVWAEVWTASALQHRCDGKDCFIWLNGDKYSTAPKSCPGGHTKGDYKQDAIGRLHLIVPELLEAGYVGYVVLETGSINDVISIMGVLRATYEKAGSLEGIAFVLRRTQQNIGVPGFGDRAGQRSRANKWLVTIEPAAEWVRAQLARAHSSQMLAAGGGSSDFMLPSGEMIDTHDAPEIEDGEYTTQPETAAAPAGGNGSKPTNSQKASRQEQIAAALAMRTPKGSPLGTLTDEQLKLVSEKGEGSLQAGAKFLLSPATGDDWTLYYTMAEVAGKSKIDMPELPNGCSLATMLRTMRDVQAQISKVEAEIPAGF